MNLNSSFVMPSGTPSPTVVRTGNAAQAVLCALNTPRLRQDIAAIKAKLKATDAELKAL